MSIACVVAFGAFSLFSAFVGSPSQLEGLRFLTGLGLGGGLPLAVARASELAPEMTRARLLVIRICASIPIGFAAGGLLASWLVRFHGWPANFIAGGALPLAIVPLLTAWLPESRTLPPSPRQQSLVAALFQNGFAPSTVLLLPINGLSLLGTYFILLWTPAILDSAGSSLSQAILATTVYAFGVIASPLLRPKLCFSRLAVQQFNHAGFDVSSVKVVVARECTSLPR